MGKMVLVDSRMIVMAAKINFAPIVYEMESVQKNGDVVIISYWGFRFMSKVTRNGQFIVLWWCFLVSMYRFYRRPFRAGKYSHRLDLYHRDHYRNLVAFGQILFLGCFILHGSNHIGLSCCTYTGRKMESDNVQRASSSYAFGAGSFSFTEKSLKV